MCFLSMVLRHIWKTLVCTSGISLIGTLGTKVIVLISEVENNMKLGLSQVL